MHYCLVFWWKRWNIYQIIDWDLQRVNSTCKHFICTCWLINKFRQSVCSLVSVLIFFFSYYLVKYFKMKMTRKSLIRGHKRGVCSLEDMTVKTDKRVQKGELRKNSAHSEDGKGGGNCHLERNDRNLNLKRTLFGIHVPPSKGSESSLHRLPTAHSTSYKTGAGRRRPELEAHFTYI